MVEVEGKIVEQYVSILTDPVSTHNYITPIIVEIFSFKKLKHRKSWLFQLATGTKRKVGSASHLNVLPLGSYDILIGMDWLEAHRVKIESYNRKFECIDEEGNTRVVRGIPKVIYVKHISAMQLKKLCRPRF